MIDIHCHILPGLDDGADTLEEALEMLRMAQAAGTTDIVATPHANLEYPYHVEEVDRRIAELRSASGGFPRIYRGCDFHLDPENVRDALQSPQKYAINHKTYILMEFSDRLIPASTDAVFTQLFDVGLMPIITHPERNPILQDKLTQLQNWADAGCGIQITAQSLFGRFGEKARRACQQLLGTGLANIVASDAHDTVDRTPALDRAYLSVEETYGRECAEALFVENPGKVLEGMPLIMPERVERRAKKWWRFA